MSSDSKSVLSGSWDKTLRLWEYPFTEKPTVFTGHTKDVLSCHFGANNRVIYSGSMDKTVKIWNVKGELKYTGTDFNGWVSCLTPIQGGKESSMMAVGSWDNKVRIFDKDFKLIKGIGSIDYPVVSMSVDDESGEFLFVAEKNGSIKIWALGGENQADNSNNTTTLELTSSLLTTNLSTHPSSLLVLATVLPLRTSLKEEIFSPSLTEAMSPASP